MGEALFWRMVSWHTLQEMAVLKSVTVRPCPLERDTELTASVKLLLCHKKPVCKAFWVLSWQGMIAFLIQ